MWAAKILRGPSHYWVQMQMEHAKNRKRGSGSLMDESESEAYFVKIFEFTPTKIGCFQVVLLNTYMKINKFYEGLFME